MSLIGVILVLIVIGVILWLINTYLPMAPPIKTVINILVLIVVLVWLLQLFGLLGTLTVPRVDHR